MVLRNLWKGAILLPMSAHLIALLICTAVPAAAQVEAWNTEIDNPLVRVVVKGGEIWFQPDDPFYIENPGGSEELQHEGLRIELKTREAKP